MVLVLPAMHLQCPLFRCMRKILFERKQSGSFNDIRRMNEFLTFAICSIHSSILSHFAFRKPMYHIKNDNLVNRNTFIDSVNRAERLITSKDVTILV